MARVSKFEDLIAWQKVRELLREIRVVVRQPTVRRGFSFVDQITRAARSTMANIAEGFERFGPGEFGHYLSIASGSNGEVRSDLYSALDAGYVTEPRFQELMERASEVARLLIGLRNAVVKNAQRTMNSRPLTPDA